MRALVCKQYGPPEPDALVVEDTDDPVPGEEQVLVDVEAAGINFPDVLTIAGTIVIVAAGLFTIFRERAIKAD